MEYSDVDRDRKLYLDFPSDLFNKDNSRNQEQESLDKSWKLQTSWAYLLDAFWDIKNVKGWREVVRRVKDVYEEKLIKMYEVFSTIELALSVS